MATTKSAANKAPTKAAPKKAVAKKVPSTKAAAKNAPAPQAATSKAPGKSAAQTTPNGQPMKGSAGPHILGDLGLTDAELAAFLPADAPRWLRGVFWCQLEGPASLDAIADHFASRFAVTRSVEKQFPEDGPDQGVDVPMVVLHPKGKYVAYQFHAMRGERYVEDGSWQLAASFREMGTEWGSNRAVYERFKALELPALGARNIVERTE